MAEMTSPAISVLKRELRKRVRAALNALSPTTISEESEIVTRLVTMDAQYIAAKTVGVYSAMEKEVDTSPLIQDAFARGKRVFLPRVVSKEKHEMKMLECLSLKDMDTWQANSWGIREPPLEGRNEAPEDAQLDVLFVPGVAFDSSGARCGHGMGFYDIYLTNYSSACSRMPYLCALALSPQIVVEVPITEQDWRMDKVVSVRSIV